VITVRVPDRHVWLRITRPDYVDPFDPSFARRHGGRWNPPESWATLYLNEDLVTVHAQVRHMFVGRGIEPDDLDDGAPILLAACTLPGRQVCADGVSDGGLVSLGLPTTYPFDATGAPIDRPVTHAVGIEVHDAGLRGVWCRSGAGSGRELAWFPATRSSARPTWPQPRRFGEWRHARTIATIGSGLEC